MWETVNYTVLVFLPEKAMTPHSSTLAWKIPWMEMPGRLQSMGSLRVRHDWATSLSLFTFMHWSAWKIPGMGGAWWAAVYGVAQSRTRLKRLSSSSSSSRLLLCSLYNLSLGNLTISFTPMCLMPQILPLTFPSWFAQYSRLKCIHYLFENCPCRFHIHLKP